MTVDEMLRMVLWKCSDFCCFECFPECIHEVGYDMYTLGMDMLETGDNPLI